MLIFSGALAIVCAMVVVVFSDDRTWVPSLLAALIVLVLSCVFGVHLEKLQQSGRLLAACSQKEDILTKRNTACTIPMQITLVDGSVTKVEYPKSSEDAGK